jgi:L-Ala-D/L-Glu epimerase / N-acetyl-D-glutamate racemase
MKAERIIAPLRLRLEIERWPLNEPFHVTGYVWQSIEVLVVSLEIGDCVGRGEAAGVYYRNDTPALMLRTLESLRPMIEAGLSRESVHKMLPPGGARNALDCALWDLETKLRGCPAWQIAGLCAPQPLLTTLTCSAGEPKEMARRARGYTDARAIKVKLTGEGIDADRIRAVREARPDVWLGVDANQGFTQTSLGKLMPVLVETSVALIEQPFPIGFEALLDGLQSPIPIAADESFQSLSDIPAVLGRFNTVNIKLDKCGGLTEGLEIARRIRMHGLETMVGNMLGTSLAMAPACLVGQLCKVVDLDGPVFLKTDRDLKVQYRDGYITCPEALWGGHQ